MLGAGAAALLVALTATPVVLGAMRQLAAIDHVNERSSHQVPTPRGGGIAVALGLFAGVLVLTLSRSQADAPDLLPMTLGVTLFGLAGLAEDVVGIAPLRRLVLQLLAALAVAATIVVDVALDPEATRPGMLLLAAALVGPVWLTAFVNAFNFMDGINGISAAQAAVAGGALVVAGNLHDAPTLVAGGALVAGAALGFAPFNFPRARIFLGDVGSYTLGAALAVLTLHAVVIGLPVEAALAPLLLYLADTGVTLLRRIRRGERYYLPHRTHTYQQLTDLGWTHTRVTLTVTALVAALSALGLQGTRGGLATRVAADLGIAAILAGYLAAPRLVASARTRRPGSSRALAAQPPAQNPTDGSTRHLVPQQRQQDELRPTRALRSPAGPEKAEAERLGTERRQPPS
ncbi:glycosyl transferase [Parafrankia colletiae]|uniref:Glycosyl transferase n=1 Tax=Parafrankia colletiae TaxID=573497 RepID=A0A1S1RHL6_9ACTN|nr:glycosyltransferase family 4 protein [Parafrankia colletiae]MCK9903271.1 glycosyltransferase family 4 protein [Frankia sp. Cpl3]OHV46243.1 glycosyl transferase [Parafrankia colletiae]